MKILKPLNKIDKFGTPVELTFNGKKGLHKTLCGGLSTLVMIIYLFYFVINQSQNVLDVKVKIYQVRPNEIPPEKAEDMSVSFDDA